MADGLERKKEGQHFGVDFKSTPHMSQVTYPQYGITFYEDKIKKDRYIHIGWKKYTTINALDFITRLATERKLPRKHLLSIKAGRINLTHRESRIIIEELGKRLEINFDTAFTIVNHFVLDKPATIWYPNQPKKIALPLEKGRVIKVPPDLRERVRKVAGLEQEPKTVYKIGENYYVNCGYLNWAIIPDVVKRPLDVAERHMKRIAREKPEKPVKPRDWGRRRRRPL